MKAPLFGWNVTHAAVIAVTQLGERTLDVTYPPGMEGVSFGAYLALRAPGVPRAGTPEWDETLRVWAELRGAQGRAGESAALDLPGVSVIARLADVSPVRSGGLLPPKRWVWKLQDVTPLLSGLRLRGPPQRHLWMFTLTELELLRRAWQRARAAQVGQAS